MTMTMMCMRDTLDEIHVYIAFNDGDEQTMLTQK